MTEWTCPEQQRLLYLGHRFPEPTCHVAFGMRVEEHTGAAFFKLRVPVSLKTQSKKTNLFVFIHPERISTLEQSTSSELPEAVRTAFPVVSNNAILQLRFTLSTPSAVLVPANSPLAPKSAASVNLLRRLRSLAQATQLTVYLAAKGHPKHSIATMCEMANTSKLKSDPSELRLETLYAGSGAKAIEGADLVFPFDHDDPPEKLVQKQALELIRYELREEMRREMREQLLNSDEEWRKKMHEMRDQLREELAQQIRDQIKEEVAQQIRDQIKEEVAQQIRDQIKGEATQNLQAELRQLQSQHKERLEELENLIEERTESVREDLLVEIEAVADETGEIVDLRVDEQILNVKEELREYVAEELRDAEDRIRDDIEQGEISFQFVR
ncbi:hypothetical protein UCDDS831_g07359 [Diplodia seriata]|uniref:Uncharacterized protein n=1 Tax=Diplodia seriata TaxID=420778 RepID=A0A0G2GG57_9PEZI|nr:hypothetical protein UCDDS831_g07359 [Diplodia seriata]